MQPHFRRTTQTKVLREPIIVSKTQTEKRFGFYVLILPTEQTTRCSGETQQQERHYLTQPPPKDDISKILNNLTEPTTIYELKSTAGNMNFQEMFKSVPQHDKKNSTCSNSGLHGKNNSFFKFAKEMFNKKEPNVFLKTPLAHSRVTD